MSNHKNQYVIAHFYMPTDIYYKMKIIGNDITVGTKYFDFIYH